MLSIIIFTIINLLLLYALLNTLWQYRLGGKILTIILTVIFVLLEERMHIFYLFGGNKYSPSFPTWLIIGSAWLSGWFLVCALSASLVQILLRISLLKNFINSYGKVLFGIALIVSLPFCIYIGLNAQEFPTVLKYELQSKHGLNKPYRIVQLTDTHISNFTREDFFNSMLNSVNSLNADLILITGDLADGKVELRPKFLDNIKKLKAKDGVIFSSGNHEYYSDYEGWVNYFKSMDFHFLENDCTVVKSNGDILEIVGVTDEKAEKYHEKSPDIKEALAKCPQNENISFKLLMKHRPLDADEYLAEEYGFDLMLSGHTHGGMVPVIKQLAALFNSGYVSGWYDVGSSKLYVSDGTHLWSGFAFRLGSKNTIAVFDIK